MNPIFKAVASIEQVGQAGYRAMDRALKGFAMNWGGRSTWGGFNVLFSRTSIDYQRSVGDPTRNSIVMALLGWVARTFPEAPVRVARILPDGTKTYDGLGAGVAAMLRLMERPNPYFSGVVQWMATVVDRKATGNAYWLKVRNGSQGPTDRVEELWWVPSFMLKPAWPVDGSVFISHYVYTVDGREYRVETWNVVHFREGIDPDNPRVGRSLLASLFREIYTDDEASNMTAALMTNLGVPGVIIAPANTTGANVRADPEAVKVAFMEKFGGDKRGEPMVLTSPTEVKVLSWSPEQMNLRELRKLPEERVSAVLGISPMVVGLGAGLDRSTFTNFGEAQLAAWVSSLIPDQRLMAAELEVQLLDDFADIDDLDVEFDHSKVRALRGDTEAMWKLAEASATKGLLMRSSFKRRIGEPIAEDGSDDVYILPGNYIFVGETERPMAPLLPRGNGNIPELIGVQR